MKKNIHLLYGDETFLIDEEITRLKKSVIGEATNLNYHHFSLNAGNGNDIINAIQTVDMFCPQKMIVIDADALFKKKKASAEDELQEAQESADMDVTAQLVAALKECPESVTVVLKTEAADFRTKLGKWLKSEVHSQEFKAFKPWEEQEVEHWARRRFTDQGAKIAADALQLFIEIAGTNLRLLAQEIDKIMAYKGTDKNVSIADIRAVTSAGELDTFELTNLLRRRDVKRALVLLQKLQKEEDPIPVLALIVSQFRLYLLIREAMEAGMPMAELGKQLQKHPFYLQKLADDLRKFPFQKLKDLYQQLQKADYEIKTGKMAAWVALEEFILSV